MTYRIDLQPETQRAVEEAAAHAGVPVEIFIARAAATIALGQTVNPEKRIRDAAHIDRVRAVRGKRAHLRGTVDDFLRERHAEAAEEMQKDSQ